MSLAGKRALITGASGALGAAIAQRLGFSVQSMPMSEGTLFANVLLVADLKEA